MLIRLIRGGGNPYLNGLSLSIMVKDVGEAGDDLPVATVTASPAAPELLKALLRRLLPTPVVLPPDLTAVPSEFNRSLALIALLLQRLLVLGMLGQCSLRRQGSQESPR